MPIKGKQPKVDAEILDFLGGKEFASMTEVINSNPNLTTLIEIRTRISEDILNNRTPEKVSNLYKLVSSIDLMHISHKKLSKNNGASTPGSENESVEKFSLRKMIELSNEIINKTFNWKYTRKIEIPRPGKDPRPLGIPNYSEKIIQNNILMILEAIFEPHFEKINVSYGFRPHKGCIDAIEDLKHYKNQGLNWAIEGDIKGAFNNVHPPFLANILKKYINDKEFIQLIYEACITPTIMKKGKLELIENSPEGTPQGSIISPILFNIYMHEFDIILLEYLNTLNDLYPIINPTRDPRSKIFATLKNKKSFFIKIIQKIENRKLLRNLTEHEKTEIHKLKIVINKLQSKIDKYNRYDYSRIPIRHYYNRYADDFIILINRSKELCDTIKNKVSEILIDNFKLQLSLEKTKITKLKSEHGKYLGFTFFMQNREASFRANTNFKVRSGRHILIGPDLDRIYNRLINERFAKKDTLEPLAKDAWSTLDERSIIEKYNSILIGLFNYYYPVITYKSEINRIYYILYYSCIKTLAKKHIITSSKIHERYGWDEYNLNNQPTNRKRIIYTDSTIDKYDTIKIKHILLYNYRDLKDMGIRTMTNRETLRKKIELDKRNLGNTSTTSLKDFIEFETTRRFDSSKSKPLSTKDQILFEDIWNNYKMSWRSKFKMSKFCNICGSEDNLEAHHIRHIKGETISKSDNFTQTIMKNLNRKQLIVCQDCHNKIHQGKYNEISLDDLYDIRTIRIENKLLSSNTQYYENNTLIRSLYPKTYEYYEFHQKSRKIINHRESSQFIGKLNKHNI